jgi:hypothetical protein
MRRNPTHPPMLRTRLSTRTPRRQVVDIAFQQVAWLRIVHVARIGAKVDTARCRLSTDFEEKARHPHPPKKSRARFFFFKISGHRATQNARVASLFAAAPNWPSRPSIERSAEEIHASGIVDRSIGRSVRTETCESVGAAVFSTPSAKPLAIRSRRLSCMPTNLDRAHAQLSLPPSAT